jgi:osmotically-inducible protein OsmY
MDPFVDASQIRVDARGGVVTLSGLVWSTSERQMADNDAWYIFGVTDVENDLRAAESA